MRWLALNLLGFSREFTHHVSMKHFIATCVTLLGLAVPVTAQEITSAEIQPGWMGFDGKYVAAFEMQLAPDWKTYWRAPGDAGIPPEFRFSGSKNVKSVEIIWPRPVPFGPDELRSVGYLDHMTLPFKITPMDATAPITVSLYAIMGVCKDICVPVELQIEQTLDPTLRAPVPKLVATMLDVPLNKTQQVSVTCSFGKNAQDWTLETSVANPSLGDMETLIIESRNPDHWIAIGATHRDGATFKATARIKSNSGNAIVLARSDLRFTLISKSKAIEVHGCSRP